MKSSIFLYFFFITFIFLNCEDDYKPELPDLGIPDDYTSLPFFEMDEEIRRYFAPAGDSSTYIYEQNWTKEQDTVIVTHAQKGIDFVNDNQYVTRYYFILHDCQIMQDYRLWSEMLWNKEDSSWIYEASIDRTAWGKIIIRKENNNYSSLNHFEWVDEIEIGNIIYSDVLKMASSNEPPYFFFAKDIGLVRVQTNAVSSFDLIHYKILP